MSQPAKIRVTLVKSPIGAIEAHKACVRGLGLRKMHSTRELIDSPAVQGMINRVRHLVKCERI